MKKCEGCGTLNGNGVRKCKSCGLPFLKGWMDRMEQSDKKMLKRVSGKR